MWGPGNQPQIYHVQNIFQTPHGWQMMGSKFPDNNVATQDPLNAWERYGARWLGLQPSTFLDVASPVLKGKAVWQKWDWMQFTFLILIHPRPFLHSWYGNAKILYVPRPSPNPVFFLSSLWITYIFFDEKMLLRLLHWEGKFHSKT